jgi:hypothetical protein
MGKDSYPVYRRRDDEQVVEVRNAKLHNRWVDPFVHSFLYREFPEYYRWDRVEKEWLQRKQRTQIGRMVYVRPVEGERYYLCILLNHVRGATSFDDLKTTGTTLNSAHDFLTQYIIMCVVVRHKNSLCSLSDYIFLYIIYF